MTESGGSTDVTEGGAQDSYDVVLDLEPSGTVTITLSPEADVSLSTTTLTFTTGNWSTPQTVTVTAVDDGDVEGAHTGTITHSASGGAYDGVSINNVVANVTDNDAPAGVTIAESGGSTDVTEGGSNDSYDVVLDAAPSGTVTVTVTPDSEVSVSTTTLIFTTGNWSTAQTVTVNAVDDAIMELPHTGTITHDATGGGYDSVTIDDVVANVTDAGPSATITESGGSTDVAEGGANDTYDVVLDAKPTSTVTVNVSPDSELQVDKSSLTFTTTDWDTPQTVTVTAANDSDVEGLHIAPVTHTATGGGYDSASISTVFANITDDDATVTVTESGGSTDVTEGGANDTYDVVLDGLPTATVTITISPGSELSVNTTTLTFTTGNWSSPQTVTVDGVSDALVEGFHTSTITHSPSGGGYDGVTVDSVVANITDAPPTVTVTESGGTTDVTEGVANDSYDVVLDAKPTASVTITITPVSQVSADKSDLTFTTLNWSTPQTVTVTAVNDAAVEGAHTGTIDHAPSGGGYDGISVASVVANVTDDDATVTVTESAASTDVTEAGANDTYDVVLDALPTGTVTITVSPDTQVSVSTTTLTFTTSDWSTPQSVTVTAIDDATVEGAHTGTITHSASGGGYGGVTIDDVVANITDAPPTVTVTESGGSTDVAEGGANDTYDVVLDAKPTGAVSITVSPDSDVSVDQGSLTFTTLDWSTPQTVTVSAVDDSTVEGTHTGTVTHSPSGGGYDGVSIASVVANVTDDDASVTVTETGGTTDVTEGGANDTYDVVLDAAPTGSVTITVSPDSQVSTDKSSLVFTTGNWSTPQTVTVDAVDDAELEGGHIGTITHSASGGGYDGVSISNVSAFVTDNEAGDFPVVSTGDSYITEDSKSTNYGSETAMYVKSRRGNRDRRAFVQFDVSSIPAGTTVSAATLTLCATAVPGVTRTYEVHRISASWVESTINWNNQPAVEASATDTVTTPASAGCMNWNVVADVQVWVDGTANNGWRVMDQTESSQTEYQTTYRTREDTAVLSERPLLDVTYSRADITPNNLATSTPEAVVSYTHTVTNDGTDSDTFDITATSNEGWTITLFESDGVTPLSDTDADTVPDTGALLPNVSVNIVVKVTVGWSSTNETTTVTATSSNDPTASANATDATTAPPTITLTLTDPTLALGSPDPNCQGNPSGTPVGEFTVYVGSTGNQGCGYAWDGITVTVKSNAAWSGTIVGADQVPTSDITVANGSFRYDSVSAPASYSDCSADTQLPTTPAPFEPGGPTGINVYNFWHCVRLDWDDGDGTIDSTITYTVSQ